MEIDIFAIKGDEKAFVPFLMVSLPSSNTRLLYLKEKITMNREKELQDLYAMVKTETAEKLNSWAEDLGLSLGETIDQVVAGYESFCNRQEDRWKAI